MSHHHPDFPVSCRRRTPAAKYGINIARTGHRQDESEHKPSPVRTRIVERRLVEGVGVLRNEQERHDRREDHDVVQENEPPEFRPCGAAPKVGELPETG
jgi:hypothetical protein